MMDSRIIPFGFCTSGREGDLMSSPLVAGRFVGQSVKRREDLRLVTGRGEYVDDVVMPRMWHAAFLRSDVARARITKLDATAASAAPGVRAVFCGPEFEAAQGEVFHSMIGGVSQLPFRPLASDDVRFVGDPVALVIADTRYHAEDACELIDVEYEASDPWSTTRQLETRASQW